MSVVNLSVIVSRSMFTNTHTQTHSKSKSLRDLHLTRIRRNNVLSPCIYCYLRVCRCALLKWKIISFRLNWICSIWFQDAYTCRVLVCFLNIIVVIIIICLCLVKMSLSLVCVFSSQIQMHLRTNKRRCHMCAVLKSKNIYWLCLVNRNKGKVFELVVCKIKFGVIWDKWISVIFAVRFELILFS